MCVSCNRAIELETEFWLNSVIYNLRHFDSEEMKLETGRQSRWRWPKWPSNKDGNWDTWLSFCGNE